MSKKGGGGEYKMETAPLDPRFNNQNQTSYCYQYFIDYHRCQKKRGDGHASCDYFKRIYNSMCPNAWVERWEDQIKIGTFPGPI